MTRPAISTRCARDAAQSRRYSRQRPKKWGLTALSGRTRILRTGPDRPEAESRAILVSLYCALLSVQPSSYLLHNSYTTFGHPDPDKLNQPTFSTMRRKSTCVFGAQVTFGIIATTSPSKLLRNCSSLPWSLVILILNRCTLYFILLAPLLV